MKPLTQKKDTIWGMELPSISKKLFFLILILDITIAMFLFSYFSPLSPTAEKGLVDLDGDGFYSDVGINGNDCDDTTPDIGPGALEICGDGIDQDCDGIDLSCECVVGETESCGTDVGICQSGSRECDSLGMWGRCIGAILPGTEICGDGIDSDCDGSDLVCTSFGGGSSGGGGGGSSGGGGGSSSSDPTPEPECSDGIDNDGDNATDSDDYSCQQGESTEGAINSQCQDGTDNDADNLTDYPNDPGCVDLQDNDEIDALPECSDGVDNDGDGFADAADFSCINNGTTENEFVAACQDGIDNDGDLLIDLNDTGCVSTQDNNETNAPLPTECSDGVDNDGDGFADAADFSCSQGNDDEDAVLAACQDGIDNDADGDIDLADVGCLDTQDNNETNIVIPTECEDGIDNDGDGFTDTMDFSCQQGNDDEDAVLAACQDGIDNDADGDIDLLDLGCVNNQDDDEFNIIPPTECEDGIDNDGDGFNDTMDFSCQQGNDDEDAVLAACQDGIDNDADGDIDLADAGCVNTQDDDEFNLIDECTDGIDNDGDGAIDGADFSCANGGPAEGSQNAECQDGTDNDLDGETDFPTDLSCSSNQDDNELAPLACSDGFDNDGDGDIDLADVGCIGPDDNDEENIITECNDGIDNDADSQIDFPNDPGCSDAFDDDENDCGNSIIGAGETCDDGNAFSGDGCDSSCIVEVGYTCPTIGSPCQTAAIGECNDRIDNDADSLIDLFDNQCTQSTDSSEAQCGDGLVRGSEVCDDSNTNNGDGCSSTCQEEPGYTCNGADPTVCTLDPVCGNGAIESGEICDDSNTNNGDGCSSTCQEEPGYTCTGEPSSCVADPICGNGVLEGTEVCDDNNLNNGDGCSSTCTVESGYSCDGGSPTTCTLVSGLPECSDGVDNDGEGDGVDYGSDPDCSSPLDNEESSPPNAAAQCENGFDDDGDGFTDASFDPLLHDPGCDNPVDNDESDPVTECSDRLDNDGDGNCDFDGAVGFPGCSGTSDADCINAADDDETTPVVPVCGNGAIESGEACDDSNTANGDGCSSTCSVEPGFTCVGEPSVCTSAPACSDGIDNDGDSVIDYPNEPGCTSASDTDETDPIIPVQCSDGVDNDGDLETDYPDDPGCYAASDPDETDPIAATCSSINWNSITWNFDTDYPCGQFINDDWWVVGPVTITSISPASRNNGGRIMHGAMINPRARSSLAQGYDNQVKFNPYNSELNKAFDVGVAGKTLVIQGGNSLVSAVSFSTPQIRPQFSNTAILTVLSSVPPAGSFRPGYAGDDKTIKFNEADLDYSKLGNLAPVAGSPTFNQLLNSGFRFSWNDGVCLGGFHRYLAPTIGEGAYSHVAYGRDYAQLYGQATLLLNTAATNAQKRDLLIRAVQVGIDNMAWQNAGGKAGVTSGGTTRNMWEPNGGNCHGRHWPILFAGAMLNDAEMRDISFDSDVITNPFAYSGQTFRVAETSPGVYVYNNANGYTAAMVGLAEWNAAYSLNIKRGQPGSATSPYWRSVPDSSVSTSNSCWNLQYRTCCTGNAFWGQILSSYIMGVEDKWNDQTLLDYQDRYRAQTSLIFPNRAANLQAYRWRSDFGIDMWDQYRASYGGVYSGYPSTPTGTLTCTS